MNHALISILVLIISMGEESGLKMVVFKQSFLFVSTIFHYDRYASHGPMIFAATDAIL